MAENKVPPEELGWIERPRNVTLMVRGFYGLCAAMLAIDVFFPKHGPFAIEHLFGFYGIYGFVACVTLVLLAKLLRRLVMRPEDYYDR